MVDTPTAITIIDFCSSVTVVKKGFFVGLLCRLPSFVFGLPFTVEGEPTTGGPGLSKDLSAVSPFA